MFRARSALRGPSRLSLRAPVAQRRPQSTLSTRAVNVAKYTGYGVLSTVFGIGVLTAGVLLHDAFTYTDRHIERVPVSPLALNPERGGPKNLPIARVFMDDEADEENRQLAAKPRLVIIGGGWGVSVCAYRYKEKLSIIGCRCTG
jgi:hypothetical protein